MKILQTILAIAVTALILTSCGNNTNETATTDSTTSAVETQTPVSTDTLVLTPTTDKTTDETKEEVKKQVVVDDNDEELDLGEVVVSGDATNADLNNEKNALNKDKTDLKTSNENNTEKLATIEAQAKALKSKIKNANPTWTEAQIQEEYNRQIEANKKNK